MDSTSTKLETIDEYVSSCAVDVRPILEKIRQLVREAAPNAQERISYGMPAFFEEGALVYFAAFKKHIGFFPPVRDPALSAELAPFAGPKGNLQFPLDKPMPHALITRIVEARLKENRQRAAASPKKAKRA